MLFFSTSWVNGVICFQCCSRKITLCSSRFVQVVCVIVQVHFLPNKYERLTHPYYVEILVKVIFVKNNIKESLFNNK